MLLPGYEEAIAMRANSFLLLVLALFSVQGTLAQEVNWIWENPLPQGNTLHTVYFVNTATGWAVGEAGTILHSLDGGATWSLQASGTALDLSDVHFVDMQHGWAIGASDFSGIILHTSDGGATWRTQHTLGTDQLVAIHFVDARNGWAAGNRTVLHTTDGGATWGEQPTGLDTGTASFTDVVFTDVLRGWIVGRPGLIVHTSDGGATWVMQDSGGAPDLQAVDFVDAATGWAVGRSGTVLHTSDGGATWTSQDASPSAIFTDVHFADALHGWITTNQRTFEGTAVRVTTDGGITWNQVNTGALRDLFGVHFADAQTGWIVGVAGETWRTMDGGATWVEQSSGPRESFWDIFHSPDGFVVAIGPPEFFLFVNENPDGAGQPGDWIILNPSMEPDLAVRNNSARGKGVVQLGSRDSYINGEAQRRVNVVNGMMAGQVRAGSGEGFEVRLGEIDTEVDFGGLDTPMPEIWWITGAGGALLLSEDGGQTWTSHDSGVAVTLDDAFFVTLDEGWVVGDRGTLLQTTDGGQSWTPQPSGTDARLRRIHFADAHVGWIVGDEGTILYTDDGGSNWTPQTSGTFFRLYDVEPIDALHAWVVGDSGTLLRTIDGGQTWNAEPSGTSNALLGVDFVGAETGWISGEGGTILRFSASDGTGTAVVEAAGRAPSVLELQNYPNPFNSSTTISFRISRPSHVRMEIYDVLGRRVATIVDGPHARGRHTAVWEPASVASGIYICRLQADSRSKVGRVVLMQ